MSVIDDLKRLERAGSESSKTVGKLIDAAESVVFLIIDTVRPSLLNRKIQLPMDYCVYLLEGEEEEWGTRLHHALSKGRHCFYSGDPEENGMGRDVALVIAKDVAEGLIGKIAEMVEAQAKKDIEITKQLEAIPHPPL